MAISSYGYGNASIDWSEWSKLGSLLGSSNSVAGPSDFRVTGAPGRSVTVEAGTAFDSGVLAISNAQEALSFPDSTGWHTVCLRRDWSTKATTLVSLATGSSAVVAANRESTPGVKADQPLALVGITAGQTFPTGLVDLRRPSGVSYAIWDLRAAFAPRLGERFILPNGDRYVTNISQAGTAILEKEKEPAPTLRIAAGIVPAPWYSNQYGSFRVQHNLGWVPIYFSALFGFASSGLSNAIRLLPIYVGDSAPTTTQFSMWVTGQTGAAQTFVNQKFEQPISWMAVG